MILPGMVYALYLDCLDMVDASKFGFISCQVD
jgi:hypothetical protein